MKKLLLFLMILITSGMETNIAMSADNTDEILSEEGNGTGSYSHITTSDLVHDIVNHPAFKCFGQYLLPWDNDKNYYNTQLNNVSTLLPYHNHVDPSIVVGAINHMIDEINDGKTIFYHFYTEQKKREEPTKESTGLFFFKGKAGAPFAILCPGGGFAYVGSLHEGFPHAIELSKKGYNAFVLKYRVGGELRATEDLAAAIPYISKKAEMFEVSVEDYSLWGSSAGARMVGNIAGRKILRCVSLGTAERVAITHRNISLESAMEFIDQVPFSRLTVAYTTLHIQHPIRLLFGPVKYSAS